jgi:hypothetical protein
MRNGTHQSFDAFRMRAIEQQLTADLHSPESSAEWQQQRKKNTTPQSYGTEHYSG